MTAKTYKANGYVDFTKNGMPNHVFQDTSFESYSQEQDVLKATARRELAIEAAMRFGISWISITVDGKTVKVEPT